MRRRALLITLFGILACATFGQAGHTFSMPSSTLFFWDGGQEIHLVSSATRRLALPAYASPYGQPVVARDGSRVALGLCASPIPETGHLTLGVFSVKQQEWKTYGNFAEIGTPGFSPDATKITFVVKRADRRNALLILDISTGSVSSVDELSNAVVEGPSWSPDGRRLAVVISRSGRWSIVLYDLGTSRLDSLAEGDDPAWSPTGEWVAYFETDTKCVLVHPDGTGRRVIRNTSGWLGYRAFNKRPVWSPDGKQLLLNQLKGEGPNIDVLLADIESGRVVRKARNGLAVIGWVAGAP